MPAPCVDQVPVVGALVLYCITPGTNIVLASVDHVDANGKIDISWGSGGVNTADNVAWAEFAAADRWHCPCTEEQADINGWRTLSDERSKEPV
mgnify:CR=1 FL=1